MMESEKIEFKGAMDEMLSGRIDKPESEVKACALFAHYFYLLEKPKGRWKYIKGTRVLGC